VGFFDKLKKARAGDTLGNAFSNVIGKATGNEQLDLGIPQQTQQDGWHPATQRANASANTDIRDTKNHGYFAALLAEQFSEYTVTEFESPASFAMPGSKPYNFLLYQAGKPVAAIMLTEGNRYQNQPFRDAKASAEAAGIPFINFFLRLPNERDYIINRIKTNLNLL
jgi:hypothetical protein